LTFIDLHTYDLHTYDLPPPASCKSIHFEGGTRCTSCCASEVRGCSNVGRLSGYWLQLG